MKKHLSLLFFSLLLFACEKSLDSPASQNIGSEGIGQGGSLARFAIVGNSLFTVDHQSLNQFELDGSGIPSNPNSRYIGNGVETIFPMNNYLFIGTISGMHIYDVSNSAFNHLSTTNHIRSCDPVVANDSLAFLTLRTNAALGRCMRGVNQLQVYDVKNVVDPQQIASLDMSSPMGLGLFQDHLFVCDNSMVKVIDYSLPNFPKLRTFMNLPNVFDVIPLQNHLLFLTPDAIYQYGYSNTTFQFISKLNNDL